MAYSQVNTKQWMNMNLLLVGMSGNGKTATLKSIVQKERIEAQGGWESVSGGCQFENCTFNNKTINVVDTPGLFNTQMTSEKDQLKQFQSSIQKAFQRIPEGFHALVLVMPYGRRYGQDDNETMQILRKVLGQNWLKTHGVVLITSGDKFKRDLKGVSFEDRCRQMTGPMGDILKECSYRCVCFDNVTENKDTITDQRALLFSVVRELGESQGAFTLGDRGSIDIEFTKRGDENEKRQDYDALRDDRESNGAASNEQTRKTGSTKEEDMSQTERTIFSSPNVDAISGAFNNDENKASSCFSPSRPIKRNVTSDDPGETLKKVPKHPAEAQAMNEKEKTTEDKSSETVPQITSTGNNRKADKSADCDVVEKRKDCFNTSCSPNGSQAQINKLHPTLPPKGTHDTRGAPNGMNDLAGNTATPKRSDSPNSEAILSKPVTGSNKTDSTELEEADIDAQTGSTIFTRTDLKDFHQKFDHATTRIVEKSDVELVEKKNILKRRQDVLDFCILLQNEIFGWAQRPDQTKFQVRLDFCKLKIQELETDIIKVEKQCVFFERIISTIKNILCSLEKETKKCNFEYLRQSLEKTLHDVIDDLEKQLDGVLTRWERAMNMTDNM